MGEPLVRPFVKEQKFGPLESKLWMFQESWVNGPCGRPMAQSAVNCNRGRHQTGPCAWPSCFMWTWWEPSSSFFLPLLGYMLKPRAKQSSIRGMCTDPLKIPAQLQLCLYKGIAALCLDSGCDLYEGRGGRGTANEWTKCNRNDSIC